MVARLLTGQDGDDRENNVVPHDDATTFRRVIHITVGMSVDNPSLSLGTLQERYGFCK